MASCCKSNRGPQGLVGPAGPAGPAGTVTASLATIIPFASGTQTTGLTPAAPGEDIVEGTLVAFGSNFLATIVPGSPPTITLGEGGTNLFTEAFSAPRGGDATNLAGNFIYSDTDPLVGDLTVIYQIWHAPAGSNVFTPIGTPLLLTLSAGDVAGDVAFGSVDPDFTVVSGDQYMLVVTATTTDVTDDDAALGLVSAGLAIA